MSSSRPDYQCSRLGIKPEEGKLHWGEFIGHTKLLKHIHQPVYTQWKIDSKPSIWCLFRLIRHPQHFRFLCSIYCFFCSFSNCGTLTPFCVNRRGRSDPHIRRTARSCINHFCKLCASASKCVSLFVPNAVTWLSLKLPFNLSESIFISSAGSYYYSFLQRHNEDNHQQETTQQALSWMDCR